MGAWIRKPPVGLFSDRRWVAWEIEPQGLMLSSNLTTDVNLTRLWDHTITLFHNQVTGFCGVCVKSQGLHGTLS